MKKIILILLVFLGLACIYLIWNEFSYSPLTPNQTKSLFKGFSGGYQKTNSKDLIGLSIQGDFYDIYLCNFDDVKIDSSFPQIKNGWEMHQIESNTIIGKWTKCPLDSNALKLNASVLGPLSDNKERWIQDFTNELSNQDNYYCYLYFDDSNQYFLLFCPKLSSLYYIRKNGL